MCSIVIYEIIFANIAHFLLSRFREVGGAVIKRKVHSFEEVSRRVSLSHIQSCNYTLHEIALVSPYKQRTIFCSCPPFVIAFVPDLFWQEISRRFESYCHFAVASNG